MTTDPILKVVDVPLSPAKAFELFTSRINEWWPVESHSVSSGQGAPSKSLTLDAKMGGALVEVAADGTEHVWGHVQEWEPGSALALTWHPGKTDGEMTRVRVVFEAQGEGCRVELTHSGWEALENGADMRKGYFGGWDGVLGRFVEVA